MNNSLLEALKRQVDAKFTGNIIFQRIPNAQFFGKAILKNGAILDVKIKDVDKSCSLLSLAVLFEEQKRRDYH